MNTEIIAETNGHRWFIYKGKLLKAEIVMCLDCGNVRRQDDKNSQCKGKVKIVLNSL